MVLYQNPKLKPLRQKLRNSSTEAECKLWQVLRKNQILGFKFIRQYSVDNFILDFYCPKLRLSVELDGSQHLEISNLKYDQARTKFLKENNIMELRFFDNEVFNNLEGVVDKIIVAIKHLAK